MTAAVARGGPTHLFPIHNNSSSSQAQEIGLSVKLFHVACIAGIIRAISKDVNFSEKDDFIKVYLPAIDKQKEILFYKISKKDELLKNGKFLEAAKDKNCRRIQSADAEWQSGVIDRIRDNKKAGHQISIYCGEQEIAELNAQEIYKRVLESVKQVFAEAKTFNISDLKERIYEFHGSRNVEITETPIVLSKVAMFIKPTLLKYLKGVDISEISPISEQHLWTWTPGLKVCLLEEFKDPTCPVLLDS